MKQLYNRLHQKINGSDLVKRIKALNKIEQGQTFRHYHMAVEHIFDELKKYNIPNAEIIKFPADGTTVYEDKRMPMAWDASVGKLTLNDAAKTVAADYTVHPFHLIKGSCSVKPGGENMKIITEEQFLAGEDPENALVMLSCTTWPRAALLTPILDLGGRGIITDFFLDQTLRLQYPDALHWVTACTEGNQWHIQADDRDFVGFSVSFAMGQKIRGMANSGGLTAFVECDGRRYSGELPAVTALIPGKRKEEIWILAHAFEPMLDDDANGITSSIEIARLLLEEGTPEYSVRLIFAMELYGFAAFHANFKGKAVGGINLDSLPTRNCEYCKVTPPINSVPFHGVNMLYDLQKELNDVADLRMDPPACFDDMFLSDSTTAIPTAWLIKNAKEGGHLWHTTVQLEEDFMDEDAVAGFTAVAAVWIFKAAFYQGAELPLPAYPVKEKSTPWREYTSKFVFARAAVGLPQDLAAIPKEKRRSLPDSVLYGPFSALLSQMDGKKDFAQLIAEAEAVKQTEINDEQLKKYFNACNYLAQYGYLKVVKRDALTQEMFEDALKKLGVENGDTLLVHSSASNCGYFEGGPEAMIRSICNVIGEEGTALFPTFTRPYIYLGGVNKSNAYRPYDPADPKQIWTGEVPRTLMEKYPAVRSRHITHSWAGLGKNAHFCCDAHGATEPPCSHDSPLGKVLELDGKILFAGSGLGPTTFIHYMETEVNANFLETALCTAKEADGSISRHAIDQHLPGHRDFYRKDAENCKFYQQAVKNGLEIKEVDFGMAKLQLINVRDLYDIGIEILKKDTDILLCDSPTCPSCSKYRKK